MLMSDTPTTKPVDTGALILALGQLSVDLEATRQSIMRLAAEQPGNLPLLARLAALEEALRTAERALQRHAILMLAALEKKGGHA
jgi:hypothetical protein